MQLGADCALASVLMSNIFMSASMQEDEEKVEGISWKCHNCDSLCVHAEGRKTAWKDWGLNCGNPVFVDNRTDAEI